MKLIRIGGVSLLQLAAFGFTYRDKNSPVSFLVLIMYIAGGESLFSRDSVRHFASLVYRVSDPSCYDGLQKCSDGSTFISSSEALLLLRTVFHGSEGPERLFYSRPM